MSLFDTELAGRRQWLRVGDAYEVTRKPRGLDTSSLATIPFTPMDSIPQGGAYAPVFTLKPSTEIKSGTYFERGDLLVAKITPSFENGKQAVAFDLPAPFGYATTEVIPLRPRDMGQDRRLLFFYLLHPDIRNHVAERMEGSTGRQRVPEDVLLDLLIPEFTIDEQSAIADAMEAVQQAIAVEAQRERITQNLKRAAMRTLFTRGLRGEAQKETEIGPIPANWNVKPLSDCAYKPDYGYTASASNEPIGPRLLRITDIKDGSVDWDVVPYCSCSKEIIASKGLNEHDIVVARIGATTGKSFLIDSCPEAVFASYLIRIRADITKIYPDYLYHYMQTTMYWQHIDHNKGGRLKGGINIPILATMPLSVPPLSEQREIATILNAIDRKIDLHRRNRALLDDLFKALLHKLMTGEIRVADLDLSAIVAAKSDVPLATRDNVSTKEMCS